MRCFPPVALAWDSSSGLHVFPNLYSETIVIDSSPALWSSQSSEKTTSMLLVREVSCSKLVSVILIETENSSVFSLSWPFCRLTLIAHTRQAFMSLLLPCPPDLYFYMVLR